MGKLIKNYERLGNVYMVAMDVCEMKGKTINAIRMETRARIKEGKK